MIEVKELTKKYGKKVAVNNISFELNRGEIVGLLGPNGAGKSTAMNMITGYLASTYGTIEVGGFDLLDNPKKVKSMIGYLPEIPPLYPDMTVKEFLDFAFDLKKCKFNKKQHLAEICEIVKINEVYGRLIKNLSKGYKQRIGLAQALIGDPEVLILDEPTIGLDPKEMVEIRNLIRRVGQDKVVIFSSHILSEVQAVCDRIIIINEGNIIMDASPEDLSMDLGPNSRYGVRLTAPEDEVIPVLSKLPGVAKVEYVGSLEKGTVDVILEADKRVDIRKVLFDECVKRNWYILMITPLGVSLEDIFIQLVDKNQNAKLLKQGTPSAKKAAIPASNSSSKGSGQAKKVSSTSTGIKASSNASKPVNKPVVPSKTNTKSSTTPPKSTANKKSATTNNSKSNQSNPASVKKEASSSKKPTTTEANGTSPKTADKKLKKD